MYKAKSKINQWIVKHLYDYNIGYFSHMYHAIILSWMSFMACVVFLIHALLPFTFTYTGSRIIKKIQDRFL